MLSKEPFTLDPREIPFLRDQVEKVLALADNSLRNISIQEDDDLGFMTGQFLCKQMLHAESVLLLVPRLDAGLIARTMIDGLYQLLWTYLEPTERARQWRSFSVIEDWRLNQGRLGEGIPVDEMHIRRVETGLKEFGDLHRIKNQNPNSPDPYYKYWRGKTSLTKMADAVGRELYDGPYAELSDWEHWGVRGIGESISRQDNHITVDSNSDRVADRSLLAAFQCLFQTLGAADAHFSLNITKAVQALGQNFRVKIDSFYPS